MVDIYEEDLILEDDLTGLKIAFFSNQVVVFFSSFKIVRKWMPFLQEHASLLHVLVIRLMLSLLVPLLFSLQVIQKETTIFYHHSLSFPHVAEYWVKSVSTIWLQVGHWQEFSLPFILLLWILYRVCSAESPLRLDL